MDMTTSKYGPQRNTSSVNVDVIRYVELQSLLDNANDQFMHSLRDLSTLQVQVFYGENCAHK